MSIENHPNFHAVKFVTDITSSYFESLRGNGKNCKEDCHEWVKEATVKFVAEIESIVDESIGEMQ